MAIAESAAVLSNCATQVSKPKVVVIGGWGRFGEVGEKEILERAGCEVVVVQSREESEVLAAVKDADGLISPPVLTKTLISALDKCKVIACSSIGMDKVDGVDLAN